MKKLLINSIALALLSSMSYASDLSFPETEIHHQPSATDLSKYTAHTQRIVAEYAQDNAHVIEKSALFLTHLIVAYEEGEGFIDQDLLRILHAVEFAAFKHRNQVRKDRQATPYIVHPIGVADHLLTTGLVRDPDILIAALLHDTVEDTDTTFEEIQATFGHRVKNFVKEVTDDRTFSTKKRKALQILHAPQRSAGAAQIKLADKFYNLRDLLHNPPP
ncbi:MAG: bifunctional (p)ppGpp synthetase/guanosine-3',5'-bis(diphosphate) 3'-pyrophosphohydrolase, partial [Verrucomicrobia bacterium]|nr:bifunctional (p)ppGpp synthetase/guanosine-3',5'-bis(diphosphate) 3'-pyrophosphohydrolase [Verrucomicrobiota bacterium]